MHHCALICHRDIRIREQLQKELHELDYQQVLICNNRDNALELAVDHGPDIMLLEAAAPVSGANLAAIINRQARITAILLVRHDEQEHLKQAVEDQIDAFLTIPLTASDAAATLAIAIHTARRTAALRQELELTKTKLQERKIIERAKGLLMETQQINEGSAFKIMRSQSMTRRISMAQLAEEMIRTSNRQD